MIQNDETRSKPQLLAPFNLLIEPPEKEHFSLLARASSDISSSKTRLTKSELFWNKHLMLVNCVFTILSHTNNHQTKIELKNLYEQIGSLESGSSLQPKANEIQALIPAVKIDYPDVLADLLYSLPTISSDKKYPEFNHRGHFNSQSTGPYQEIDTVDPINILSGYSLSYEIDETTYPFLVKYGYLNLMTDKDRLTKNIANAIQYLLKLAHRQAPFRIFASFCPDQQALYQKRYEEINYRIKQLNHFSEIIDLFVFSRSQSNYEEISIESYSQAQRFFQRKLANFNYSKSRKNLLLDENLDQMSKNIYRRICRKIPSVIKQPFYILYLFNQDMNNIEPVTYIDWLENLWIMLNNPPNFIVEYQQVKAEIITDNHMLVKQVFKKTSDLDEFIVQLSKKLTTDFYSELLSDDNKALVSKKLSIECIRKVLKNTISANLRNWQWQSIIEYYITIMLSSEISCLSDEGYDSEKITNSMHLSLINFQAKHQVDSIFIALFAAICNPRLSYDMTGLQNQCNLITLTKKIIDKYLTELQCYNLSTKQARAIHTLQQLLLGKPDNKMVETPKRQYDKIIGYHELENILCEVLTVESLQIFSDVLQEKLTVGRILSYFYQKIVRPDFISRYNHYAKHFLSFGNQFLSNELQLATAYLWTDDSFIMAVQEKAHTCLQTINLVIVNQKISPDDIQLINENYSSMKLYDHLHQKFEQKIKKYLTVYSGSDLNLAKFFMQLGILTTDGIWHKSTYPYIYFEKLINGFLGVTIDNQAAIKTKNLEPYFLIFTELFNDYSNYTDQIQVAFANCLRNFHNQNNQWLSALLRCSESLLTNHELRVELRSELFICLFEDLNNTRELGEFVFIIKNYHQFNDFEKLLTVSAHKKFGQQLQNQINYIESASFEQLIDIIACEKWLYLLGELFPSLAHQYVTLLIKKLLLLPNIKKRQKIYHLLIGNLVKQLPRHEDNVDKVKISKGFDSIFDDQKSCSDVSTLLIKHFASEAYEKRYYELVISNFLNSDDLESLCDFSGLLKKLYSKSILQDLVTTEHYQMLGFVESLLSLKNEIHQATEKNRVANVLAILNRKDVQLMFTNMPTFKVAQLSFNEILTDLLKLSFVVLCQYLIVSHESLTVPSCVYISYTNNSAYEVQQRFFSQLTHPDIVHKMEAFFVTLEQLLDFEDMRPTHTVVEQLREVVNGFQTLKVDPQAKLSLSLLASQEFANSDMSEVLAFNEILNKNIPDLMKAFRSKLMVAHQQDPLVKN